jgi:hypothetical protein
MKKSMFLGGTNGSKRPHTSKSQMKTMLINFFDTEGFVHFEFIPHGQLSLLRGNTAAVM